MPTNLIIAIIIAVVSFLVLIIGLFVITRSLLRIYWFAKGKKCLETQKWDDAIKFYTRIIKVNSRDTINALSLHNRGSAYYLGKRDFEAALEDYNQSINYVQSLGIELRINKLSHLNILFHLSRGNLLYRLERFDEALSDLEIAKNLLPQYKLAKKSYLDTSNYPFEYGVQAEYAVTLFACGKIDEAQAQWRVLKSKIPPHISVEQMADDFNWIDEMIAKAKELEASFVSN